MDTKLKELSTSALLTFINEGKGTVLDVRPIEVYNGWPLQNEERGGHIVSAKSIPLKWTRYMDWIEVLEEKEIHKNRPVVVYGYTRDDSRNMANKLRDLGYPEVLLYNSFLKEWAHRDDCPMDRLPRFKQLVYPGWVHQLIHDENPPGFDGEDYVICHSHYGYPEDYEKGHIPEAVALDTNSLESPDTWNRRPPDELRETLQNIGIGHDTTVVVYGRFSSPIYDEEKFPGKSAGHLGALRCAAIMLYAGVRDVKILNGGITSWEKDGYECSTTPSKPKPLDDFGAEIPAHPEYMIDTPEARQYLASEEAELVSIRSWPEFIGERSGYHYIEKKGRIPGAVFGNCGTDAYHMENYRNFDHTMREYHEIAVKWEEAGITPDKRIAFYCGTGWRGSEAFMNAYLMGWPNVSVYDGGWYEWSNDPSNPIETGVPEDVSFRAASEF